MSEHKPDPKASESEKDAKVQPSDVGAGATAPAKAKEERATAPAKERDERAPCMFLPGDGSTRRPALIHERSRADINVAELELRDGKRVQSVPRWNGVGERPPFDVWTAS